ncbi:MAG: hypothetical protein O2994_10750, partial [Proteobacteria bacterium]|nr:hypothetical protein [Pseudomonadota bacterium]
EIQRDVVGSDACEIREDGFLRGLWHLGRHLGLALRRLAHLRGLRRLGGLGIGHLHGPCLLLDPCFYRRKGVLHHPA